MKALAAAVTPIMKFDVAVATLNGTPITRYINGTLTGPPPMPSSPETIPAPAEPTRPSGSRFTLYGCVSLGSVSPSRKVRRIIAALA